MRSLSLKGTAITATWAAMVCAAGAVWAGVVAPPPPEVDSGSSGDGAVLLLLLLGAVVVAAAAAKPKTQPTIVDDEAEAGDGKY